MTDVPDWAIERARELCAAEYGKDKYHCAQGNPNAFARYIAEHEQPPVDPLLAEAREIAAQAMEVTFPDVSERILNRIRSGDEDCYACVSAALAALRRGLELARTKSEAGE